MWLPRLCITRGISGRGNRQTPAGVRQPVKRVALDGRAQRRPLLAPVGEQFVQRPRLDDGARDNVSAHFRRLLHDADVEFLPLACRELPQAARSRETRRTGTDDDYVEIKRVAFHEAISS